MDSHALTTNMENMYLVAEFMEQSRVAAIDYGYDPERIERFMLVRGSIAELAIVSHGVSRVEEITEEVVKDIALESSPMLQTSESERRKFKRAAEIDALTGLGSRYAFEAAIDTAEKDKDVAFLKFDANNFGKINKELGDDAGDEALKGIAKHIRTVAEKYGFGERTFRPGGDEFVVLASMEAAYELMAEINATYGNDASGTQQYGSTIVSLTGGIGNTLYEANQELRDAKAANRQKAQA